MLQFVELSKLCIEIEIQNVKSKFVQTQNSSILLIKWLRETLEDANEKDFHFWKALELNILQFRTIFIKHSLMGEIVPGTSTGDYFIGWEFRS